MTMISSHGSAEIFAFMPRKGSVITRAYSAGTRKGGNAVVDLTARTPAKVTLPRMDFGDAWYHAEAIQDSDRTRER